MRGLIATALFLSLAFGAGEPASAQSILITCVVTGENPALRSETLAITHEDHDNQVLAFKRWHSGNVILTALNLSEVDFGGHAYGVDTGGQSGRWKQLLTAKPPMSSIHIARRPGFCPCWSGLPQ